MAFGENAAEPHHEPDTALLDEGDVIKMDFGALYGGYHADMTRTVAFGEPAAELKKVHDIVQQAQQAGIDAVAAGVTGQAVDVAARAVIEDAGYGQYFSHGLGHGVGLDIHEGPRLGREFASHVLPAGAVVTVEPGIYIPGLGGVRIEDMVEVTDDGGRVLGTAIGRRADRPVEELNPRERFHQRLQERHDARHWTAPCSRSSSSST